jgi:hypothetical protein
MNIAPEKKSFGARMIEDMVFPLVEWLCGHFHHGRAACT